MECNKDEAIKARELAEKKLEGKDINGARKFAMKAQSLYPGLDGLQHLLTAINIYVFYERKINGEVDWYGVLGVDPSSDDVTVKKQYRKLALILHPDKNKSVGAEGAFKILSEAWSLLSDNSKRAEYDQRKKSSSSIFEKVIPTHPSKSVVRDNLHASANSGHFNGSKNAPSPHLGPSQRRATFWTVCTRCKMQFEYVTLYLNKKLECYSCKQHFQAIPIAPPHTNFHPPQAASANIPLGTFNHSSGKTFVANGQTLYSGAQGPMPSHSSVATMNEVPSHKNLKRTHLDSQGGKVRKRRQTSGAVKASGISFGSEAFTRTSSADMYRGTTGAYRGPGTARELTGLETLNMLIGKAKKEICKKIDGWKSLATKSNRSNVEPVLGEGKSKCSLSGSKYVSNADVNVLQTFGDIQGANAKALHQNGKFETSSSVSSGVSEEKASEVADLSMTVPDSDFHDFDKYRTENSFGDNQVWAAYDDDDGMPRYYAMIHNVVSRNPFKMRISWLNSKSTAEFGGMNWVGCGFYKTSGDFRVGRHELNKTVNAFSHSVKWTKGARGAIRIYPSKGDIWALYKNWSSEWNEHTPDEVVHQYDMVEVLTDYDEERGVTVIPLVKVSGFKTVFLQHMDQEQVRVIPREEMFRFSHQVPSCLLTGKESSGAPKGCLDLDPAATPIELLQVITERRVQTRTDNDENDSRSDGSNSGKTL